MGPKWVWTHVPNNGDPVSKHCFEEYNIMDNAQNNNHCLTHYCYKSSDIFQIKDW
jgi:hypothetical protein